MTRLSKAALGAAVALSVLSITDAVVRGAGDDAPPWDPDVAAIWVIVAVAVLEAVTFLLLAAVLVTSAAPIDAGSGWRRWIRRALVVDLVVLTAAVSVADSAESDVLGAVAGTAFLLMFLLGIALGALLLRRPALRLPAVLMAAPVVLLPLAFAVDAVAPGWGHPGYAESALYLGIALLGSVARQVTPAKDAEPFVASQR
jgi:hypothetical protein